jgi:hypothetical protein
LDSFLFLQQKDVIVKSIFNTKVNSILATISIHLLIIILFLSFKLGENEDKPKSQVLIEFNPEPSPLELKEEKTQNNAAELEKKYEAALNAGDIHSMASNAGSKIDDKINTYKYEQQVMQELGIKSLKTQAPPSSENTKPDENSVTQSQEKENEQGTEPPVPNVIRKENTTVSYFLDNRWHRYLYIPTYKCQGGGTVVITVIIDQSGRVASATIAENKSTRDQCLLEEAYHSASTAVFNADPKSPAKQVGTITYVFLAQ